MKVLRLKPYLRACKAFELSDDAMRDIELSIAAAPLAHPIIKGLRGARKARIALSGRGKRGGGRVVYYVVLSPARLYMLTAYAKNERADLTSEQRKAILAAIEVVEGEQG
jgi:hypothetical protein